jgi:hypothetical protein
MRARYWSRNYVSGVGKRHRRAGRGTGGSPRRRGSGRTSQGRRCPSGRACSDRPAARRDSQALRSSGASRRRSASWPSRSRRYYTGTSFRAHAPLTRNETPAPSVVAGLEGACGGWAGVIALPVGPKIKPLSKAGVWALVLAARLRGLSRRMACTRSQRVRSMPSTSTSSSQQAANVIRSSCLRDVFTVQSGASSLRQRIQGSKFRPLTKKDNP